MKRLLVILSMLSICFGGDLYRINIEKQILIIPQSITINSYNSIGFSNINFAAISDLPNANPASITDFNSLSAGINMQYSTKFTHPFDIEIERDKPYLPGSAVVTYSWYPFYAGLAYHQNYNSSWNFGEIPITSIEDMDGSSGQTFSPKYSYHIYSFSGLAGYRFDKVFNENDQISFGLQISWGHFNAIEEITRVILEADSTDWTWKVGLNYGVNDNLKFGILYDKGIDIIAEGQYDMDLTTIVPPPGSEVIIIAPVLPETYKIKFKLPDRLTYGISVSAIQNLWFNASLSHIFWNQVNDSYKNELEYSFSAVYKSPNMFSFSASYYHTDFRCMERSDIFNFEDFYNLHYVGFGMGVNLKPVQMRLEALNSRLLSNGKSTPAHFKFGLDYMLQ